MKYLKRFNESNTDNIISECKDILLELSDKDIKYRVYGFNGSENGKLVDVVRIELGDQSKSFKLQDMDLMFEHLFSYIESEGFKLGKDSYFENSSWDLYEACPECDSESVTPPNNLHSMEGWKCDKCGHEGHQDDFQRPEHPVTKKELFWGIKENYHIHFMSLSFYKSA